MEEIARTYARSLFEAAEDRGKVDEIKAELDEFTAAVAGNRDLSLFLFSPYFSVEEKRDGIRKVVEDATPEFTNFLDLLVEKGRTPLLPRINSSYEKYWADYNKLLPVTVTSAVELPQETIEKIRQSVEAQTGRKVELSGRVDDSVVGGIVLQVGNRVLDASIRGSLDRLRREVAAAH